MVRRTGQYILYDKTQNGLKNARTIKLVQTPQQWIREKVEEVDRERERRSRSGTKIRRKVRPLERQAQVDEVSAAIKSEDNERDVQGVAPVSLLAPQQSQNVQSIRDTLGRMFANPAQPRRWNRQAASGGGLADAGGTPAKAMPASSSAPPVSHTAASGSSSGGGLPDAAEPEKPLPENGPEATDGWT